MSKKHLFFSMYFFLKKIFLNKKLNRMLFFWNQDFLPFFYNLVIGLLAMILVEWFQCNMKKCTFMYLVWCKRLVINYWGGEGGEKVGWSVIPFSAPQKGGLLKTWTIKREGHINLSPHSDSFTLLKVPKQITVIIV